LQFLVVVSIAYHSLQKLGLKGNDIPFLVRPITSMVANRIFNTFLLPNVKRNFKFLEQQLETSGGDYLCGDQLTAADILMSFPLIASKARLNSFGEWEGGSWDKASPRVAKYIEVLENSPGYKKSVEKIEAVDGKFVSTL
jgi:glutathione S-transferase